MKTIEEKVAVYKAWLEGEPIEVSRKDGDWVFIGCPSWDWKNCDYRVRPAVFKPRDMRVAKAYVMSDGYIFWTLTEPAYPYKDSKRAPEFDLVANP